MDHTEHDNDEQTTNQAGWGKFHRQVRLTAVFGKLEWLQLYCEICCRVSMTTRPITVSNGKSTSVVVLHPGQFLSRRKSTADMLGMDKSTYQKRFEKLIELGVLIVISKDTLGTIVSLAKFDDSEPETSQSGIRRVSAKNSKSVSAKTNQKTSVLIDAESIDDDSGISRKRNPVSGGYQAGIRRVSGGYQAGIRRVSGGYHQY